MTEVSRESVGECQSVTEGARVPEKVSESARICQRVPGFQRECQSVTGGARVPESMPASTRM